MTRRLPIDTALYLRADEFIPATTDSGGTIWPLYGRGCWVNHDDLMPLLYSGVMWEMSELGRLTFEVAADGTLYVHEVEQTEEERQAARTASQAGESPDSYAFNLMLGFMWRMKRSRQAEGSPTATELAGWGLIHERDGRQKGRLDPHSELEYRGVLRTPDGWQGEGMSGGWQKFKRRIASRSSLDPKPRAEELLVDEANLAALQTEVDAVVGRYRTWQQAEPDLAARVHHACVEGYGKSTPFKGISANQIQY